MVQEGSLGKAHDSAPGLPRGRASLPATAVRAAQRERLITATIGATAEQGFGAITVADIVRRAKVSRAAFYTHFRDKKDCFLTATDHGGTLLIDTVITATRQLPSTTPQDALRAGCRAYLRFLADEPAFARVFFVDMPMAGAEAVGVFDRAIDRFARIIRGWHDAARRRFPDWPQPPFDAYLALSGATVELVSVRVRRGRTDQLPELEDTIVALYLAVLAGRAWH